MGYEEDWAEIQADPSWADVPQSKKLELARFYARKIVKPAAGKDKAKLHAFLDKHVVTAPRPATARTRDFLVESVKENILPGQAAANAVDTAKGAARKLIDEGPVGPIRRATGAVADAAYDAIARPTGLPTAAETRRRMGMGPNGRVMPEAPWEQQSPAEQAGSVIGEFANPVYLAAPLNAFAKAAPAVKAGVNLLPKAAAPSVLREAAKGAVGAGATNAAIAGTVSIASQAADQKPIDLGRAAQDAAIAGTVGAALGAPLAALPVQAARQAAARGDKAAQARIAAGMPEGPITGGTVSTQTLDTLDDARRMAEFQGLPHDVYPGSDIPVEPLMDRHLPADVAGFLRAERASEDFLRPSFDPPAPPPARLAPLPTAPLARADLKPLDQLPAEAPTPNAQLRPGVEPDPALHRATLRTTTGDIPVAELRQVDNGLEYTTPEGLPGWVATEEVTGLVEVPRPVAPAQAAEPPAAAAPRATTPAEVEAEIRAGAEDWAEQMRVRLAGQGPRLDPLPDTPTPKPFRQMTDAERRAALRGDPAPASAPGLAQRLLSEEDGAMSLPTPEQARANVQSAARGAGDVAIAAGKGYATVTEGLTKMLNIGLEAVRAKDALRSVEAWRQLAKHKETGLPIVDEFRRAFITNFGVPPEVLRLADEAGRQARQFATPMRRQALALLRQLDGEQQAALELAVTEPTLRAAKVRELAKATGQHVQVVNDMVQSILDDSARMTNALQEVGAVTETGAARWEGRYLPRTYERTFQTISNYFQKSNSLKGKQGRGIEKMVAPSSVPELQAQGWEFRGEVGGKARVWRDYTLDERFQMDQVFHASQAMGKMANEFERDFRNGKLLADIAKASDEKGAFAIKAEKGAEPPQGYRLFSNAEVQGTGIKRWGAIADHYVRDDVAHYLTWASDNSQWVETLRNVKTWTGTNVWKRFKTLWNPSYYVNNFMQNIPMHELAGGSVGDLPAAFREAAENGQLFRALEEFGTIRNGRVAQDLATSINAIQMEDWTPLSAMKAALSGAKNVEAKGGEFSQATDDLFRIAYVQAKMRDGLDFETAARAAEKVYYDSTKITAPAAQVMEAFGFPFVRVFWYLSDRLPELLIQNPAKAAVLLTYFQGTKWMIDRFNGTTDKQAEARETLIPKHMKKAGGLGYMPWPGRDSKGNQQVVNTANWAPTGFIDNAAQMDLPYFPAGLQPGGVVPTLYQATFANRDTFRDKPLRTEAKDDTGRYLAENLGPGVVGRLGTLWDAAHGRESYSGLPYDAPTALAGLGGLKLQPYIPEQGLKNKQFEFEQAQARIRAEINRLATMAARNPQDAEAYQREIERQAATLQSLAEAYSLEMERAQGAL